MKRMHTLWCEIRPQYGHLEPQHLRDQVAALKKRGFPAEETPDETSRGGMEQEQNNSGMLDEDLETRYLLNLEKYR